MTNLSMVFHQNKELPFKILMKLKERKVKIRKFMLYVNGILNETEQDMQQLCGLFSQFETLIDPHETKVSDSQPENRKKKKRVSFASKSHSPSSSPALPEEIVIPETAPTLDQRMDSDLNTSLVVPESCNPDDDLLLSPFGKEDSAISQKKEESRSAKKRRVGINHGKVPSCLVARESTSHSDSKNLKDDESLKPNRHTSEGQRESSLLSPISSLLDDLRESGKQKSEQRQCNVSRDLENVGNAVSLQPPSLNADFNSPACSRSVNGTTSESNDSKMKPFKNVRDSKSVFKRNRTTENYINANSINLSVRLSVSPALFDDDDLEDDDDITQLPAAHDITQLPAAHDIAQLPAVHDIIQLPASHDITQLPAAHDITQLPASHDSTQLPASHDITQLPASHDSTQLPASHDSTQLPASHDITQLPASHDSTQLPASHDITQLPASHDITQLPASHDITQYEPSAHDITQISTDDITRMPASDDITRMPASDDITQISSGDELDAGDLIKTKRAKKAIVWPIGYRKFGTKGKLVVEPVSDVKSRKRARQTRLDGFMAKASTSFEPSCKPLITIRGGNSGRHSRKGDKSGQLCDTGIDTKPVIAHVHSDSDEDLAELDLKLLDGVGSKKQRGLGGDSTHSTHSATPVTRRPSSSNQSLKGSTDFVSVLQNKSKYQIGEVVRGKARKQLPSYRCMQCYEYYRTLNLSEEEIQGRLDEVCRHRAVKQPMETPPNFWNMSIQSFDD